VALSLFSSLFLTCSLFIISYVSCFWMVAGTIWISSDGESSEKIHFSLVNVVSFVLVAWVWFTNCFLVDISILLQTLVFSWSAESVLKLCTCGRQNLMSSLTLLLLGSPTLFSNNSFPAFNFLVLQARKIVFFFTDLLPPRCFPECSGACTFLN
jgi:hypothetical protein